MGNMGRPQGALNLAHLPMWDFLGVLPGPCACTPSLKDLASAFQAPSIHPAALAVQLHCLLPARKCRVSFFRNQLHVGRAAPSLFHASLPSAWGWSLHPRKNNTCPRGQDKQCLPAFFHDLLLLLHSHRHYSLNKGFFDLQRELPHFSGLKPRWLAKERPGGTGDSCSLQPFAWQCSDLEPYSVSELGMIRFLTARGQS